MVKQLILEIDARHEQQQRLLKFEQLAREAMDNMSYDMNLGGEKQAVQALDLYGVINDDHWLERLQAEYLSKQQQSMVQQTVYETLLVLADFGIRWTERKTEKSATVSLQYLERAEAFHPPTRAFYWVRSECHKFLDNLEEAEHNLKLFQTTTATTAFDYYLPGHTAGWRGDLKEANRSFEAALRIQPDHFNSLYFLAARLEKDGRIVEACQVWRACLALRPNHIPTLRNRAIALGKQGKFEEALESATKAIELNSKSNAAIAFGVRGSIYLKTGQFNEALADLDEALRMAIKVGNPSSLAHVYNSLAWVLATCHDSSYRDASRAVELASQAVQLSPGNAMFLNTLGVSFYRDGDYSAAITHLAKSVERDRKGEGLATNGLFLAMAHWRLGDHDEARQWYEKALKAMSDNNSTDAELIRFRAETEETLGIEPLTAISEKMSIATNSEPVPEAANATDQPLQEAPPTSPEFP